MYTEQQIMAIKEAIANIISIQLYIINIRRRRHFGISTTDCGAVGIPALYNSVGVTSASVNPRPPITIGTWIWLEILLLRLI